MMVSFRAVLIIAALAVVSLLSFYAGKNSDRIALYFDKGYLDNFRKLHESSNEKLLLEVTLGQSLGLNRVGGADKTTEDWSIGAFWDGENLDGLVSFNRIIGPGNESTGSDYVLEDISERHFSFVRDRTWSGTWFTEPGTTAESPHITGGIIHRDAVPNRDVFLASLVIGGKSVRTFSSDPELAEFRGQFWFRDALQPFLKRAKTEIERLEYTPDALIIEWLQGERDHSRNVSARDYANHLQTVINDITREFASSLGVDIDPVIVAYQMGRTYQKNAETLPHDSHQGDISSITKATIGLGLSDAKGLENFIIAPPSYAFQFSGISHMSEGGYHALQSLLAHTAQAAIRSRSSNTKWKPLHATKLYWHDDAKKVLNIDFDFDRSLGQLKVGVPDAVNFHYVPEKRNSGLSFHCSDDIRSDIIASVSRFDEDTIQVNLNKSWDCDAPAIGIAYNLYFDRKSRSRQGWQRREDNVFEHASLGSNIYVETDWVDPFSGKLLPMYASHQLIEIE